MTSITIAGYPYDGPYTYASLLDEAPGVWAILHARELPPVDAGEAEDIRAAVERSDRFDCWQERCERVTYAEISVPDPRHRAEILEQVMEAYNLPCRPE